ncbi:hypothetical protein llap_2202 [Limosa lapponica baueri]|uniref:Glycerol kinase n=1 Tax=Limosa lapponica baueri TaxID=1758121 RepID=A0A2I0UN51_LIMLA|nr:hypothetical protein llap_2202 [Limosa lapponica baueri]
METWWAGSYDSCVGMEGYRLFRKDRQGRQGRGVALYVSDQPERMELRLGMDEEPDKSLWVRIKGRAGTVIEEPTRRGAMLDLVLNNKEGLVGIVKLKGSLDCSDHEMVKFKTLRGGRRPHSKLINLDLRRADFGLFMDLLVRVMWDKVLEGRGTPKNWLIFKDHLLQAQEEVCPNKEKVSQKRQEACMNAQGTPGQTQTQKGSLQRVEARTGSLGGN